MLVLYYTIGDESTPGGGYIRPSSIYQRTNTTKRRYDNRVRGYRLLVLGNALYLHTEYWWWRSLKRLLLLVVVKFNWFMDASSGADCVRGRRVDNNKFILSGGWSMMVASSFSPTTRNELTRHYCTFIEDARRGRKTNCILPSERRLIWNGSFVGISGWKIISCNWEREESAYSYINLMHGKLILAKYIN